MRVLVSGSRTISSDHRDYVHSVLQQGYGRYDVLIHGDAKGLDTMAAAWAWKNGVPVKAYPAEWKRYGKSAGPIRNAQMLTEGKPDILLAFVDKPLLTSRGTRDMVTKALDAGLTVHVFDVVAKSEIALT